MGATKTHYFGKVCAKHPELLGERTPQHWCIGCRLATDRKRRKNPARLEQNKQYLRALRQRPGYAATQRNRNQTPARKAWDRAYRCSPERLAQRRVRYATNAAVAIKTKSQTRIRFALMGQEKSARTLTLLGVPSIEFYKSYLEAQFQPGMTWDNAGSAWHIDHRIPLSLLDLSKPEDQRFGFNYKNTRPMWAQANRSRSNKLVFEDLL